MLVALFGPPGEIATSLNAQLSNQFAQRPRYRWNCRRLAQTIGWIRLAFLEILKFIIPNRLETLADPTKFPLDSYSFCIGLWLECVS